jgi:hypothetical protein
MDAVPFAPLRHTQGNVFMNSPANSQGSSSTVATPTVTKSATPSSNVPAASPVAAQARSTHNAPIEASSTTKVAEAPKVTESPKANASKGAQNGAGGLRQAVQELVSSVECLCGEPGNTDASRSARKHLEQAKTILSGSVRDGMTLEDRSPDSNVPAPKVAGTDASTRPDAQRSAR